MSTIILRNSLIRDIGFINEFENELRDMIYGYINSGGGYHVARAIDYSKLDWLAMNTFKAQKLINAYMTHVRFEPLLGIKINNYPIAIDSINACRRGEVDIKSLKDLESVLLNLVGEIDTKVEMLNSKVKNPLNWLLEGIKELLSFPITIANLIGLVSDSSLNKSKQSVVVKICTFIGAIAAFISAIVTIIQGELAVKDFFERILFYFF